MLINKELEDYSPQWFKYLTRAADLTKLKTAPNTELNMNQFAFCIVGEANAANVYFDKKYEQYCSICKKHSYEISKAYHLIIQDGQTKVKPFNETVYSFLIHFKSIHIHK